MASGGSRRSSKSTAELPESRNGRKSKLLATVGESTSRSDSIKQIFKMKLVESSLSTSKERSSKGNLSFPKFTLLALPDEILLTIFRSILERDMLSIALVNRQLYRIASDPAIPRIHAVHRGQLKQFEKMDELEKKREAELLAARQNRLGFVGIFMLGRHMEALICVGLLISLILSMIHVGLPSLDLSWMVVGIPFAISLILFWLLPVSFSLINIDHEITPENLLLNTHLLRPKAMAPCYALFARRRQAVKWFMVGFLLLNLTILMFIMRAMSEPRFMWWLCFIPFFIGCLISPLFYAEMFSADTAKKTSALTFSFGVSFLLISLKLDGFFSTAPFVDSYYFIPVFILQVCGLVWFIATVRFKFGVFRSFTLTTCVVIPIYVFEMLLVNTILYADKSYQWAILFLPLIVVALTAVGWCICLECPSRSMRRKIERLREDINNSYGDGAAGEEPEVPAEVVAPPDVENQQNQVEVASSESSSDNIESEHSERSTTHVSATVSSAISEISAEEYRQEDDDDDSGLSASSGTVSSRD